jgi:hypothetical protein
VTTDSRSPRPAQQPITSSEAKPDHPRLTAEERETILIRNDVDRTWSVYSDSTRKGRFARWLRALGIEPAHTPGGGIEAEGIPEWAVSFRAKKRRGRLGPGPLTRNPSGLQKPPIQRHPERAQAPEGRETPRTSRDPDGSRVQTGPDEQTGLPSIESERDRP